MKEKVVLITGGNSGIGKATACELASLGACVILACRNKDKAEKAVAQIKDKSGNERVFFLPCDLSSFASIQQAAEIFHRQFGQLDILINNAGIFTTDLQFTEEGYELQFGVNHLGHFLLTHLLLDSLQKAPSARIINVSSVAYMRGKIDFDNLKGEKSKGTFHGLKAYAQSKLANVLFTRELSRRFSGITANALHPGVVRTGFGSKKTKWSVRLLWLLWQPFMRSPENGASTSIYLATAPRLEGVTGQFFDEKGCCRRMARGAKNEMLAKQLWRYSEEAIGGVGKGGYSDR